MGQLQIGLAAATIIFMAAPANADSHTDKAAKVALALTPEHFRSTAKVSDDSLDTTATISTEAGFQDKRGLLGIVWNDNFLRAFIDKKTGVATFQVYQRIAYSGDWRFYQQVNYETPDGPQAVEVTSIAQDVVGCSAYGGCTHDEAFGFSVPESLLRRIASLYQPGVALGWRFKFKAKAGDDWQDGMLPAEIVGMLQVVDAYRRDHGLSAAMTDAASVSTPPPQFGIDVDMVGEGAYIKSVAPGSVAASMGIVPGMVISKVNGESIKGVDRPTFGRLIGITGPRLTLTLIGRGDVLLKRQN